MPITFQVLRFEKGKELVGNRQKLRCHYFRLDFDCFQENIRHVQTKYVHVLHVWESIGIGRNVTVFPGSPSVEDLITCFTGLGTKMTIPKIKQMQNSWARVERLFREINRHQRILQDLWDEWLSDSVKTVIGLYPLHTRRHADHKKLTEELPKWINLGRVIEHE